MDSSNPNNLQTKMKCRACLHILSHFTYLSHEELHNMYPALREQTDIVNQDRISAETALDFDPENDERAKDMADQRYKNEADVNYMLGKFNIVPNRNEPMYGEWDFSVELQSAIESVRAAKAGLTKLPEELRAKFGSMDELLHAVATGQLVIKDEEAPEEPKTETDILRERLDAFEKQSESKE